jgi:membrane glycosyltransferase
VPLPYYSARAYGRSEAILLERSTRDLAQYTTASPSLAGRRALYAALVAGTMVGMLWLIGIALSTGGIGLFEVIILALFAITLPWCVIGFWNSVIGFLILRFTSDSSVAVLPAAARVRDDDPVSVSTAILMCIRNEVPERVIRNIEPMIAELVAAGVADCFHFYVLSDTNRQDVGSLEDEQFGALAARWLGRFSLTYRRREKNVGFKAGNIRDFCDRWGSRHELAIVLDTDSLMPAAGVLRLVRIMQANPRLGILQSLVIGLPTTSAFARIFQFGMRLKMRCFTIGSAWWQGDCGPYWGHNAALRLAPFVAHCKLPVISGHGLFSGEVLSHDQLEAVLMRRAGFEVRLLPEENIGWEENPPTLMEFIRRDLRWCQGNMQYWHFLTWPGLRPVSRYQLAFAILMFFGWPAWIALLVLGTLITAFAATPTDVINASIGIPFFWLVLLMWFAPTITRAVDILLRPKDRRQFGGTLRLCGNVAVETIFSILLEPIMWFEHTMFLIGMLFGRTIGWGGQVRDDHHVPVALAARNLWPHTAFGIAVLGILASTHPPAVFYAFFIAGGPALSIPLAVITAMPALGNALTRIGIGRLPEETAPPPMLTTLALPAVMIAASKPHAS